MHRISSAGKGPTRRVTTRTTSIAGCVGRMMNVGLDTVVSTRSLGRPQTSATALNHQSLTALSVLPASAD